MAASPDDLVAARSLMAWSLGIHIVLSCLGIALPAFIWAAHRHGLRGAPEGRVEGLVLARRWSKAAGVLFAVGAVSGTVLSFEMGLLWPGLMGRFGAVIGLPFALEGVFFFLEAIFLGIYLYGWRGLPARVHLLTLVPVIVSGVLGAGCVIAVNAWMNDPAGFDLEHFRATGEVVGVAPWAALFNRSLFPQLLHMLLAAYLVTAGLIGTVHATGWLRRHRAGAGAPAGPDGDINRRTDGLALRLAALGLAIAAPLQLVSGDLAVRNVDRSQPAKLAAMELVTETGANQPYTVGGVLVDGRIRGGFDIPNGLSIALHGSPDAVVSGLDAVPADQQPPVNVVRIAFQLMVAAGTALVALAAWVAWSWWRRRALPTTPWFARAMVLAGPAAVVALEAGWTTTEVGRQPWIVWDLLRVADAVTPRGGLGWVLAGLIAIYAGMVATTIVVLRSMSRRWRAGQEVTAAYEPIRPVASGRSDSPAGPADPGPAGSPGPGGDAP